MQKSKNQAQAVRKDDLSISRRDFLKIASEIALASLLVSCSVGENAVPPTLTEEIAERLKNGEITLKTVDEDGFRKILLQEKNWKINNQYGLMVAAENGLLLQIERKEHNTEILEVRMIGLPSDEIVDEILLGAYLITETEQPNLYLTQQEEIDAKGYVLILWKDGQIKLINAEKTNEPFLSTIFDETQRAAYALLVDGDDQENSENEPISTGKFERATIRKLPKDWQILEETMYVSPQVMAIYDILESISNLSLVPNEKIGLLTLEQTSSKENEDGEEETSSKDLLTMTPEGKIVKWKNGAVNENGTKELTIDEASLENKKVLIVSVGSVNFLHGYDDQWIALPEELPNDWVINEEMTIILNGEGDELYKLDLESMAWVELVQWITIKNIEDYADNPLTLEDFEPGGKVDSFFEEVRPEIIAGIDWDKIDDDDNWWCFAGTILPRKGGKDGKIREGILYDKTETNPFIRDFDAFGEIIVGKNKYIFMPLIILDKENQEIYFIKLAYPLQRDGVALTQKQINGKITMWLENMNVSTIDFDGLSSFAEQPDPLFVHSDDPRYDEIVNTLYALGDGDFTKLKNISDLILLTEISRVEGEHLFE